MIEYGDIRLLERAALSYCVHGEFAKFSTLNYDIKSIYTDQQYS